MVALTTGKGVDRADGPGVADVARIAWPVAISMLSTVAMNVTDSMFVGRLGTADLAAVGLAANQVFLAIVGFTGLLEGVRVNVAHATGGGRHADGRRFAWAGLSIALAAGLCVAAWAPLADRVFALLGADADVADKAAIYFAWRISAAPLQLVTVALSCWFGGRGETRTPMVAALLANATSILLDAALVFGVGPIPAQGIAGAGMASATAQAVGCAVMVASARPLWRKGLARPRWDDVRAIVRVGAPIGVKEVLDVGAFTGIAALLASAGEVQLAAHVVAARILSASFMPGYAIAEAGGVLVGQSLGAGRPEGARRAFRSAATLAVGLMCAFAVLFALAPSALLSPFGVTPDVEAVARQVLLVGAVIQLFDALAMTGLCALNGAGDSRFTMVFNVATAWLVELPVAFVLCRTLRLGAVGAWGAILVEVTLLAVVFGLRIRGGRWLARHG